MIAVLIWTADGGGGAAAGATLNPRLCILRQFRGGGVIDCFSAIFGSVLFVSSLVLVKSAQAMAHVHETSPNVLIEK